MAKKQLQRLTTGPYFDRLAERAKKSRAYTPHQALGLEIAEILRDRAHKALYIKLAKEHNPERLLRLAKSVAERPQVKKRGAYFMKLLHDGISQSAMPTGRQAKRPPSPALRRAGKS